MSASAVWYYAKGNQQLGPVERPVLDDLIRRGEIGPNDLVWTEGMASWAPARDVLGLHATPTPPGAPPQAPYDPPIAYATVVADDPHQKTLAILAIVFGCLGLFCCPIIIGVAGIVCGALAVNRNGPHDQLARTGLIIAIVGTVLGTASGIFFFGILR